MPRKGVRDRSYPPRPGGDGQDGGDLEGGGPGVLARVDVERRTDGPIGGKGRYSWKAPWIERGGRRRTRVEHVGKDIPSARGKGDV